MKKYFCQSQKGFTLANMLITLSILVILSALVLSIYFSYNNVLKIYLAKTDLQTYNIIALNRIASMIKSANNIPETKTINSNSYTTSTDTLILELPSVDSNQDIITNTYDYIVYYLDLADTTKLKSSTEAAAGSVRITGDNLVANNVKNLIFNYNNDQISSTNRVNITLTLEKVVNNKVLKLVSQTSAGLRNK